MKILDVGCGTNKHEGAIGLDNNPRTGADVIHDLGEIPYPFADNEFDLIVSNHTVEHVPDVMAFPTHRNHINSYTFNTFLPGRQVFDFYTQVQLKPVDCFVSLSGLWKVFGIEFLVNLDRKSYKLRFLRKFWEQYLSYIIRGKELRFEFEVIKGEEADGATIPALS